MKEQITYSGNGQIRMFGNDGKLQKFKHGDVIKRGDIPNDAFNGLMLRPDFGADLDTYRASRGHHVEPEKKETNAAVLVTTKTVDAPKKVGKI